MEPQNAKINYLQIIGKSLPLMSIFLVVIGYIKTYFYYAFFSIDITPYITLSDLPFIIPPDLIIIIPLLIVTILPFTVLYKLNKLDESSNIKSTFLDRVIESIGFKNPKIVNNFKRLIIIILALFSTYLIYLVTFSEKYFINIIIYLTLYIIMIIVLNISHSNTDKNPFSLTSILLIFSFVLVFPAFQLYTSTKKVSLGFYNNTRVITNHDTITANIDYIYVGGLSGYVFFYDIMKMSHTVIPRSEILKLDIHQYEYPKLEDSITTK